MLDLTVRVLSRRIEGNGIVEFKACRAPSELTKEYESWKPSPVSQLEVGNMDEVAARPSLRVSHPATPATTLARRFLTGTPLGGFSKLTAFLGFSLYMSE